MPRDAHHVAVSISSSEWTRQAAMEVGCPCADRGVPARSGQLLSQARAQSPQQRVGHDCARLGRGAPHVQAILEECRAGMLSRVRRRCSSVWTSGDRGRRLVLRDDEDRGPELLLWDDYPRTRQAPWPASMSRTTRSCRKEFVQACERSGLRGCRFFDAGAAAVSLRVPWFVALPAQGLGHGLDHPWFDRRLWIRTWATIRPGAHRQLDTGQNGFHQRWLRLDLGRKPGSSCHARALPAARTTRIHALRLNAGDRTALLGPGCSRRGLRVCAWGAGWAEPRRQAYAVQALVVSRRHIREVRVGEHPGPVARYGHQRHPESVDSRGPCGGKSSSNGTRNPASGPRSSRSHRCGNRSGPCRVTMSAGSDRRPRPGSTATVEPWMIQAVAEALAGRATNQARAGLRPRLRHRRNDSPRSPERSHAWTNSSDTNVWFLTCWPATVPGAYEG